MIKYEHDSRKVINGQTFVAIKGLTVDGHDYINKAIENGASHIICEKELDINIPYTVVENSEEYLKKQLVLEYSDKFKDLKIIGVTGTNGKTTTCYIIYQLLQSLNINATYIGTLGFINKEEFIELNNTTPDILRMYNLLDKAVENNSTHVVIEVSSHSLSLDRLAGINLCAGAFTNLTQDHLDYHKTMDNYLTAKMLILKKLLPNSPFIANSDDDYATNFINNYDNVKTIGTNADYKILDYVIDAASINLKFNYDNKEYNSKINLTSKFNVYNYLTAIAILNSLNYDLNELIEISNNVKAPKGRCETIKVNNGFAVIDYAHTPDAVEKVITAYNELKTNKVITIIGCGGDRDPKKRPIMGNIASTLSDYVIFTNDNPRTEDETLIMKDIINGVTKNNYEIIHDRKEAINKGITMMNNEDILLILGKGHEDYQIIGHTKYHLDDAEEVLNWSK